MNFDFENFIALYCAELTYTTLAGMYWYTFDKQFGQISSCN